MRNYVPDSTLAGTQHKLCTYRSDPITITIDQVAAHQSEERTRSNHGAAVVTASQLLLSLKEIKTVWLLYSSIQKHSGL